MSLALSSVDYILNRICDLRACSWSFLASISVPFFSFWSFLKRGADEEKVAIEAVSGSATLELLHLVESIWESEVVGTLLPELLDILKDVKEV